MFYLAVLFSGLAITATVATIHGLSHDIQNGSCWSLRYSFINLKDNGQGITEIWNFHAFTGDPHTPEFSYCLNLT